MTGLTRMLCPDGKSKADWLHGSNVRAGGRKCQRRRSRLRLKCRAGQKNDLFRVGPDEGYHNSMTLRERLQRRLRRFAIVQLCVTFLVATAAEWYKAQNRWN